MVPTVFTRRGKLRVLPELLASLRVAVIVRALPPSVIAPLDDTVRDTVGVAGSVMLKVARLSVPLAPPGRPVPEFTSSVPRPMSTVSPPASVSLSGVALKVSVTLVADSVKVNAGGPVKVTVGVVAASRSLQVTPLGRGVGQAVV